MPSHARAADTPATLRRWLTPTVVVCAIIIVVAIALGLYAHEPRPPVMPGGIPRGRMLPRVAGPPPNLPVLLYMLGVGSVVWFTLAIALPFMLWGARRIDASRGWLRATGVTLGILALLVLATTVVQYVVVYGVDGVGPGFGDYFLTGLRQSFLPWIALTGIVAVVEARRRATQAEIERERLRAQVAEQRLIALSGQLRPHFLFNTLQAISTLIHRDAETADEMLAALSDLLRDLLRHRDHVLISLEDEIRFTRTYLEIAHLRFADRLQYSIDVTEDLCQAAVPLFILQPLVENALAHGIGGRAAGGSVAVRARRDGDRLRLEVADDGAGMASGTPIREGVGLSNTRERLRATYGPAQSLSLEPLPGGGTVTRVEVPFSVIPHARVSPSVIPHERSECRDLT